MKVLWNVSLFTAFFLLSAHGAQAQELPASACYLYGETQQSCTSCSDEVSGPMLKAILPMLTTFEHRTWHNDWHYARDAFKYLTTDLSDQTVVADYNRGLQFLASEGFLSQSERTPEFEREHAKGSDGGGEDFFYMHRDMIKMVQMMLASHNLPCIAPWVELPTRVFDPNWPTLSALSAQRSNQLSVVNDLKAQLKILDDQDLLLRDPKRLRSETLGQLSAEYEIKVHDQLHEFFKDPIRHCQDTGDESWNTPFNLSWACNDLKPTYSSPLNPYFWKIHGHVDLLIGEWLSANGYTEIAEQCPRGHATCYQWKSTWEAHPDPSVKMSM